MSGTRSERRGDGSTELVTFDGPVVTTYAVYRSGRLIGTYDYREDAEREAAQ